MPEKNYLISVIVPVYNEIDNIAAFHKQLESVLEQNQQSYEIIYVDDNSTDGTYAYLENLVQHTTKTKQSASRNRMTKDRIGGVKILRKVGKQGKAYSLKEGFDQASGSIFAMIDGDLQYPPQAIPQMIEALKKADIVVAKRKNYQDSFTRKIFSNGFKFFFGKVLFGLSTDIQSGLKVFKSEIYQSVKFRPGSPWTFDLEFLYRAREAGFIIKNFDITFAHRFAGNSKVSVLRQTLEIGLNALYVKSKRLAISAIPPMTKTAMQGAGIGYKRKKYITHTTLPVTLSAFQTFSFIQKLFFLGIPSSIIVGLWYAPLDTARTVVGILSILYFTDALFNLFLVIQSLKKDNEIRFNKQELENIDEATLPVYTILCPLYKEAQVVPQFLEAIANLDWPKNKLDVMFLLEEDDEETIVTFEEILLPYYARTVIVPNSVPKTKPKACNYGLSFARGDYLVIYDAEDIPDPLQLKKAYVGFQKVPRTVTCLQAKLNYYNTHHNLLTRLFTAEYSLWFDVTLTGLQSLNSIIPLGGTSNHFKTSVLRDLQGWDPFNVTEDADLGIRLFQKGYQTAIIDSTTMEEATSKAKIWLKQRSRWIKGYMQTYLVHTRNMGEFIKRNGLWHNFIFQFTVGGKILFLLLNPFMWVLTLLYFTSYPVVGPTIEKIYVPPISYVAVTSWIFGNFLFFYYYMIGIAKRGQWDVAKYVFFIPFYWLMMSMAGAVAFYQLLFKPHYWEKTVHGFHLGSPKPAAKAARLGVPVKPTFVGQRTYANEAKPAYTPSLQAAQQKVHSADNPTINVESLSYANSPKGLSALILRMLPLAAVLVVDVIIAGYVLTPDTAPMYLLMSFFLKIVLVIMQVNDKYLQTFENNILSFFSLFHPQRRKKVKQKALRILIFNWRDTKHIFSGGAEVYVHQLAKRWVMNGNKVTVFCGNDQKCAKREVVDGVEVIRRGGTYTVYLFAFIYYVLKLRRKYDVIVDCENGIPFFTPLFTRKPVILLIHHVHQEIFRTFLRFPLRNIASFLESKVMPRFYKRNAIVTVSESSRKEIYNLGFTHESNIAIVYNGISSNVPIPYPKTEHPSILYLGRLAAYKNIDIAIKAFEKVVTEYPHAVLTIAGSGGQRQSLINLVHELGIEKSVIFLGRVSEKEKSHLLTSHWMAIQPSVREGWGITVIEANAHSTPVIASKVSGLKDSVIDGYTGFLVEKGNIKEFSDAMFELIDNEQLRNRFSQNAYVWSMQFDWDKSAYAFYSIIEKVIDGQLQKRPIYKDAFALQK